VESNPEEGTHIYHTYTRHMNAITLAYCSFHSINYDDIMDHKQKLGKGEESYLNHASKNTFICELHDVHWFTDHTPSAA
jgi:hypothetical protein